MVRPVGSARGQRGFALLALLAVIVMVFAYVITSRLNAASAFVASDREHNSQALARAKQALIGYMAQQASLAGENNPGRLPCPEAVNAIGVASAEGIAAPLVSPSTPNCATLGRFPWRTVGVEKLVDASSEPLWYAVSPGWRLNTSSTLLTINPDSVGSMTINGAAAPDVIAVIIAPGPAMNVQAASGCSARQQSRSTPAPSMDARDYVECFNAATPAFATAGPATSFNDQVVTVTTAELMPALEAAIQERMQREIAPAVLNAQFALDSNNPRRWVSSTGNPPVYPYPVPFTTPTTSLSNFRGATGTSQGLMPFAPVSGFVSYQSVPPNVVKTSSAGSINSVSCYWESATVYACEGIYVEDSFDPTRNISVQMTATFTNVAMGFRTRNTSKLTAEARNDDGFSSYSTASVSTNRRLEMNDGGTSGKPRGSVTVTLTATLPNIDVMGWGNDGQFRLRIDRAVIGDHCLLSTTTGTSCAGSDTSWFARNEWYRNVYYAVADQNIPDTLPWVAGCDSTNCLRFNDDTVRNTRVLLVIAGRKLDTQTRPSSNFADYIEYQNADSGTYYEQHRMRAGKVVSGNSPWNDRLVIVDWISPAPTFPVAYLP